MHSHGTVTWGGRGLARTLATGILALLGLMAGLAGPLAAADRFGLTTPNAPGIVKIDVLFTSDIHGHIDPQEATFLNPQFPPPLGGGASAATYIDKVRAEAKAAGRGFLLLDSGDMFQGTPVGMFFKGQSVIEWMNSVGFTAAALGNHDFDLGWRTAKALVDAANFPILSANLYDTETGQRVDWAKDMTFVDCAGVKVAIIGMITEETVRISFADNIAGITFKPVHKELPGLVEKARANGAELVLLAVHSGLPYKPIVQDYYRNMLDKAAKGFLPVEYNAMELAHFVPGVDVIFGGHSHQGYDQPWEDPLTHTVVVEPYANGSSIGHVTLTYDTMIRKMVGYETHNDRGALATLYEDEFWPKKSVADSINAKVAIAEKGLDLVIGETRVNLQRGDAEKGNLGALVADAIREYTNADVALQNTGGVRADIAPGEITRRDCLSVLPFGNQMVVATVKGEFLRRLLEQKVGQWGVGLFVSGVTVEFNTTRPQGERILSIKVGDQPLDPARDYTLAMTNFLSEGNSGMTLMREVPEDAFRYTGTTDREALERFVQKHSPINPKSIPRWVSVSS